MCSVCVKANKILSTTLVGAVVRDLVSHVLRRRAHRPQHGTVRPDLHVLAGVRVGGAHQAAKLHHPVVQVPPEAAGAAGGPGADRNQSAPDVLVDEPGRNFDCVLSGR